ncbi:hypothetical protein BGLA2_2000006 [Burkholderia gladioli]|nr:hypothetical protein BGLA2_2000006 [Burkholderia gladioli]
MVVPFMESSRVPSPAARDGQRLGPCGGGSACALSGALPVVNARFSAALLLLEKYNLMILNDFHVTR